MVSHEVSLYMSEITHFDINIRISLICIQFVTPYKDMSMVSHEVSLYMSEITHFDFNIRISLICIQFVTPNTICIVATYQ